MRVLTKYDQIEPIYLPQSIVTYIYLHPVYHNIVFQALSSFNFFLVCYDCTVYFSLHCLSSSVSLAPTPLTLKFVIFNVTFTSNHLSFFLSSLLPRKSSSFHWSLQVCEVFCGRATTFRTTPKPGGTKNTVTRCLKVRILEPEKHCRGIHCYAMSC
jgi:hypothetical protein